LWGGVHRPCEPGTDACAVCQRVRTVSRAERRGPGARPERGRDLARPGRRTSPTASRSTTCSPESTTGWRATTGKPTP
jgi:hypothetical protein